MKHWRSGDDVVVVIPKEELHGWLHTPAFLELVEEHLASDEELIQFDVRGNDTLTLVLKLDLRREGEESDVELDRRENGVPLV